MARAPTRKEFSALKAKVDKHDEQIGDLFDMSRADHNRLLLQEEATELLRKLAANNTQRIKLVEENLRNLSTRRSDE